MFNHDSSGFFARAEVQWYGQHNSVYSPGLRADDFFQENLYVGYRFPRGLGELRLGILNLSGQDSYAFIAQNELSSATRRVAQLSIPATSTAARALTQAKDGASGPQLRVLVVGKDV